MRHLSEELIEYFNEDLLSIHKSGPLRENPTSISLVRTKTLQIEFEVTFAGIIHNDSPDISPGTIYRSEDAIEFSNPAGAIYTVSGLICSRQSSSMNAGGTQTKRIYSVDKVEMRSENDESIDYIIEWVGNLSKHLIGYSNLKSKDTHVSNLTFGRDDNFLSIDRSIESSGSERILKLNVSGTDIYLVNTRNTEDQKSSRSGYLLYNRNISLKNRNMIRDSISFIIGLPIILFGYTEYSKSGQPLYMKSFPVYAFGRKILELVEFPPYPIASGHFRNNTDMAALEKAINAIYSQYEDIKFDELYWIYWHGVCASTATAAVYFAGLCEQLQRAAKRIFKIENVPLINSDLWRSVQRDFLQTIEALDIDPVPKKILINKISGLNQVPQSVAFDRLLKYFDLSISEVERSAWKYRNSAAHGTVSSASDTLILSNTLLRIMFHRILASITNCSDKYIDYYNLDYPTRPISESIPPRQI